MGPKYEFTSETLNWDGHLLYRIRRLSDGKRGGWIESEENLDQEYSCWVDDEAKVYSAAQVYGWAQVYGDACVCGSARVRDHAQVYDRANIRGHAGISGAAEVYGNAKVYGNAYVGGNAKVHGNIEISKGKYTLGDYIDEDHCEDLSEIIKNFIYRVDDSDELKVCIEYDSIDEFFDSPVTDDTETDTLDIRAVASRDLSIKIQKIESYNEIEFELIVDVISEDGDNIIFKSMIESQTKFYQLLEKAIDILNDNSNLSDYGDELDDILYYL